MNTKEIAARLTPELIELRRHFHRNPELSLQEFNTAARVAQELRQLGILVQRIGDTGVVGVLKGKKPGKTIALRGDMDALPITENTSLPFVSQVKGVMHACGHDLHTTCLIGAAKILSELKDELCGTVKFIFQPAEEIAAGAKLMLENHVLKDVDAILGMHTSADIEAGTFSLEGGSRMTSADTFKITVKGVGGHGGAPHEGVDALLAAAHIVTSIQAIVSREISPLQTALVHIGTLHSGSRFNIIADEAVMEGSARCFLPQIREKLPEAITRISVQTAKAFRATAEMEYTFGCPPTLNDFELSAIAEQTVSNLFGKNAVVILPPTTGAEDFAYYMEKIPGVFILFGIKNEAKMGKVYPLHSANYVADEDVIPMAAATYAQFALDYLFKNKR